MSDEVDQATATALQRVLLPPSLPELRDWAVSTLYEPAGEAVLVGGDFYDWFTMPHGTVVFIVGDISGKGPLAGALGMSIRKALKGICWTVERIVDAFPILESALQDEFHDDFATLCALEIQPGTGRVTVVLAGHPAPWLRRSGVFEELAAPPNGVLGPRLESRWESLDVVLDPGDTLLVHSDGLSEARLDDGRLMGEGPFEEFLHSLPRHLSSYETVLQVDQHLRRMTPHFEDDVIIGVFTRHPAQPPVHAPTGNGEMVALRLTPDSGSAAMARRFAVDACTRWQVRGDDVDFVQLVVSELVTNAVLHARTDMELRVSCNDEMVRVEVLDHSSAEVVLPADDGRPDLVTHGRGLRLVQELATGFGVEAQEDGKIVWVTLAVGGGARPQLATPYDDR